MVETPAHSRSGGGSSEPSTNDAIAISVGVIIFWTALFAMKAPPLPSLAGSKARWRR
jgi:hypothetical protein